MGTGAISILLSVLYVKFIKIKTPDEYSFRDEIKAGEKKFSTIRALSPYIIMMIMLPVVRYTFPWDIITKFGYIVWVDCVIFICGIIGAFILRIGFKEFMNVISTTSKKVIPVMVTMGSLLITAYIMQSADTGMITLIARTLAGVGALYPAMAVFIGCAGSFVTGTGLGSNIMFAPLHMETSAALGINPITVFAGQNAGASLGNLICPNNTVAACATVDRVGQEGAVLKKSFFAFAVILALYMIITMLYTHLIFANVIV